MSVIEFFLLEENFNSNGKRSQELVQECDDNPVNSF